MAASETKSSATADERAKAPTCGLITCMRTVPTCASDFSLGMVKAIIGATLLHLQYQTQSSTEKISSVFLFNSFGLILGNILIALIYRFARFRVEYVLSTACLILSLATLYIPWCTTFVALATTFIIQGLSYGLCGGGGTIPYTINTWQEKAGIFIQTMCFLHSVGATLTPYVVSLVIPELDQTEPPSSTTTDGLFGNNSQSRIDTILSSITTDAAFHGNYDNFATNWTDESGNITETKQEHIKYEPNSGPSLIIAIPFILPAVGLITSAIFYIIIPPLEHRKKNQLARNVMVSMKEEHLPLKQGTTEKQDLKMPRWLFTLSFCFCAIFGGIEITYGGWIIAFGVEYMGHSYSDIALAASLFWFGGVVGRLLAIYGAKRFPPKPYIYVNLVTVNVANIVWLFMGQYHLFISYVCAFLTGMAILPLLGAMFMYLQTVTVLEEWVASVLHLALHVGGMTLPYLVGFMFANISPLCFLYVLLASTLCELALFMVIVFINNRSHSPSFEQGLVQNIKSTSRTDVSDSLKSLHT